MSFMNPVDMVEEDAADLQFPKVRLMERGSINNSKAKKMINAETCKETKYVNSSFDINKFNSITTQYSLYSQLGDCGILEVGEKCVFCECTLHEPYIKCPDCDVLLCLVCFARGRETTAHRNSHAYVIVRDNIQVFPGTGNWTAREEMLLLRTLQTQGYGNWEAVSQALRSKRSPEECCQHYHNYYFGGIFERLLGLTHATDTYFPERIPYIAKMRSVDPPRYDDISSIQFKMMAGYRCARGDFDTPYDVSAESLITIIQEHEDSMRMDPDRDELNKVWSTIDETFKCALIRAYNNRLRERQRRYKIMKENGLIMENRTLAWISKYSESLGSDINCRRFLIFMQICTPIKFDMMVESLKLFSDIRKDIFRLYELRQNGVPTLEGGALYFKLKRKRLVERQNRLKNERYNKVINLKRLSPDTSASQQGPFIVSQNIPSIPRKKPPPMDITGLPGYVKLTEKERELCSVERLIPQAFLEYKSILIAENTKIGQLRLADARRLIKIDVNKTRQIYDFLIDQGHINKPFS